MRHPLTHRKCLVGGQVADNHGDEACTIQPAVVLLNPGQTLLLLFFPLLFALLVYERLDLFGD